MRAGRWRGADRDRGAATVWVVVVMAVLGVICGAVLAMSQVVVARHRAGGAADLAVLAAADRWADGSARACEGAVRVAGAQGARVVRCVVRGEISEVTATAPAGPFSATVNSRAGPAGPPPTPGSLTSGRTPPTSPPRSGHLSLRPSHPATCGWGGVPWAPPCGLKQSRRSAADASHPPTRLPRDAGRE
ncbi:Rv3654c family TadE-like protein [Streptomyces sp. NPDC005562]|uniref:Rv3654c family TadE-like protein n=1 Tax=Streptomyces sp. NPDC005562 TaxID=3154890 RepID=UPI0033B265E6